MQVLDSVSSKSFCCPILDRSVTLRMIRLYGTEDFERRGLCCSFYFHLIIYLDLLDITNFTRMEIEILSFGLGKAVY